MFRTLTPAQQARLSWHQRERYKRAKAAYVHQLEAEVRESSAWHRIIEALDDALNAEHENRRAAAAVKIRANRPAASLSQRENARRAARIAYEAKRAAVDRNAAEALAYREAGWSIERVAAEFRVSTRTVERWLSRARSFPRHEAAA